MTWTVEYSAYVRDEDGAVKRDYPRDEEGKKLPDPPGSTWEKYPVIEGKSVEFGTDLEAANFIRDWTRKESSDAVSVSNDDATLVGQPAITWAQEVIDAYETRERINASRVKYVEIKGKRYIEV